MKIELTDGIIIEGSIKAQSHDKQPIDDRTVIRIAKGELIKALTRSLTDEKRNITTATDIAKEIRRIFRIEYRDHGTYKEMEYKSLVTEVRRILNSMKRK